MSDQDSTAEDTSNEFSDRRSNNDVRLIFDKACEITASFFDTRQSGGDSSHAEKARQALRNVYPELTQEEVDLLYAGVERYHQSESSKTDNVED